MKKIIFVLTIVLCLICVSCIHQTTDADTGTDGNKQEGSLSDQSGDSVPPDGENGEKDNAEENEETDNGDETLVTEERIMYITVNGRKLTAELEDNSSARALTELLKGGPLTVSASDYGNFEKVGSLGVTLPRNDKYFTTAPGDLILYQGSNFVLYYDVNSYTFTKLGKVKDITRTELVALLGKGDVEMVLSLS